MWTDVLCIFFFFCLTEEREKGPPFPQNHADAPVKCIGVAGVLQLTVTSLGIAFPASHCVTTHGRPVDSSRVCVHIHTIQQNIRGSKNNYRTLPGLGKTHQRTSLWVGITSSSSGGGLGWTSNSCGPARQELPLHVLGLVKSNASDADWIPVRFWKHVRIWDGATGRRMVGGRNNAISLWNSH